MTQCDDGEGDDSSGRDHSDGAETQENERLERIVAVISVTFTVLLLCFVLWLGVTTSEGAVPSAAVESVESPPYGDGGPEHLRVTVRLENRGESGIDAAVVAVECGSAVRTVRFTHVPGDGHETATVTCPVGTTPTATVENWNEA